jgi:hypothetical protein
LRIVVNDTEHSLVLIGKGTMGGAVATTPAVFALTKDPSMEANVEAEAHNKSL